MERKMKLRSSLMAGVAAIGFGSVMMAIVPATNATTLVQISQGAFTAGAGVITFSEFPSGTQNPSYTPATYGGVAGDPNVNFGGYFTGQSPGSSNPSACPAGAAVTGCVLGSPTGPLTLAPIVPGTQTETFITGDSAQLAPPILSGFPTYNGSIAILFSTPQSGVGLEGGYFDNVCSTGITAFDASGNSLGTLCNDTLGDEFLGLVTSDGSADISGLLFSLVGDEPAGFDVDTITFGTGSEVTVPGGPVPEPATLSLLGMSLVSLAVWRRRKKT
jgi:hypothetical protein